MATAIRLYRQPDGLVQLTGIDYPTGRRLSSIGWVWARGIRGEVGGCWGTRDEAVVEHASSRLGLPVEPHPAWQTEDSGATNPRKEGNHGQA